MFLIQSILSVSPVLRPYTCDDYSPYLQPGMSNQFILLWSALVPLVFQLIKTTEIY